MATVARGIRNNNPGNLRKNEVKWQGLADGQDDPAFFVFKDAVYGIRAIARTLITYQDRYGLSTIRVLLARYAPPSENDTLAYANSIAGRDEIDKPRDMHSYSDLRMVVAGIILHENGSQPYTPAQIDKALVLAGVEAPKKSLIASGQIVGNTIAAAAIAAGPVVQQVQTSLQPLTDYSETIKHVFVVVALLGIVLGAWAKVNERRKGIS